MKNFGSLIPPAYHHQPGGIVGDRSYLESLKKAIEEALESGVGTADVFTPDGEGHYVFVKLEEDEDKVPICYAHFEFTGKEEVGERIKDDYAFSVADWKEAYELLDKLEGLQNFEEKKTMVEKNFRNLDTVRKQIEDTKKLISLHINLLKKYPEDKAIKLSLEQYIFLLKELAREWKMLQSSPFHAVAGWRTLKEWKEQKFPGGGNG